MSKYEVIKHKRRIWAPIFQLLMAALGTCSSSFVTAQDLEPRSYFNLPVGQNFLVAAYGYSEGELNVAPGVPLEDTQMTMDSLVVGYARSLNIGGKSGKISLVGGNSCMKGDGIFRGEFSKVDRCGWLDPRIHFSYNFFGAPAMTMAEFQGRKNRGNLVAGVSLLVIPPLGDYSSEYLFNTSGNRWVVRPEIGVSKGWGKWSAELALGVRFFSDNDDFFNNITLEQDELYNLQGHLMYSLRKGRWISINSNYFWGGRTTKGGQRTEDRQSNSRFGATLNWPLNSQHALKFFANTGYRFRIGNDFNTFGIAWQYRWGPTD